MLTNIPLLALSLVSFVAADASPQKCTGQSCYVASLSGSTEEPYKMQGKKPAGGNAMGDTCIKNWYKKMGLPAPQGLKRYTSEYTQLDAYVDVMTATKVKAKRELRGEAHARRSAENVPQEISVSTIEKEPELEKRQSCTPYVLLYARGTTETGDLGMTVGPALRAGLAGDKNWSVRGISSRDGYAADLPGIYCIGLTGGMACKDILNKMSTQCPNSKFVTAGYSQGAMVARECVAFAEPAARAKVVGILTYGDPFNGATVKGFPSDKIKVNCNPTDGVCKGDFSIGAGHLSYSTTSGVAWLKQISAGGK